MRSEPAAAALVRLRLTHQVPVTLTPRGGDALAIVEGGPLPAGRRVFVPGLLPCGECAACRRALCNACSNALPLGAGSSSGAWAEVPERFVVAVDDDDLPARSAIAAGLLSDVLGAVGRAGLGPGDTAIWIGRQPWLRIGASWSVGRGCRTFVLSSSGLPAIAPAMAPALASPAGSNAHAIWLAPDAGAERWNASIAEAEAAGGPVGGCPERRIFICGNDPTLGAAAVAMATAGSTLSFLLGAPAAVVGLDGAPPLRLFTGGAGHPDLVTEALAALRRREVDMEGVFVEVPFAEQSAATASFQAAYENSGDRPVPVLAFL
jgi:hypothetical protein